MGYDDSSDDADFTLPSDIREPDWDATSDDGADGSFAPAPEIREPDWNS